MPKFYDPGTLSRLQGILLSMLKDFIDICEKNDLTYFGIAGTTLGAIRHGGFIPWDDDIDIGLPREDFEKFIKIVERDYGDVYRIVNTEHYSDYPLMTTRMCLKGSVFREEAMKDVRVPFGIFLDLYPFDHVSKDPKKAKKQARDAWFWSKIMILRSIPHPVLGFSGIKAKIVQTICAVAHAFLKVVYPSKLKIYRKANEAETRFNKEKNVDTIAFLCDTKPDWNVFKKSDLYPLQTISFEGIDMKFPRDYKPSLVALYGEDYMTPPPKEKRKTHYPYRLRFPRQ